MSNILYYFTVNAEGRAVFHEISVVGEKPTARCGSAMTVVTDGDQYGFLYIVGGADGYQFFFDVWRIQPRKEKAQWERMKIVIFFFLTSTVS